MKTKLLKKVRKRFEIIKVDKLSERTKYSNPHWNVIDNVELMGLPLYYIYDNDELIGNIFAKTEEEIKEILIRNIKEQYAEKFPKKDKITKIWHIQ